MSLTGRKGWMDTYIHRYIHRSINPVHFQSVAVLPNWPWWALDKSVSHVATSLAFLLSNSWKNFWPSRFQDVQNLSLLHCMQSFFFWSVFISALNAFRGNWLCCLCLVKNKTLVQLFSVIWGRLRIWCQSVQLYWHVCVWTAAEGHSLRPRISFYCVCSGRCMFEVPRHALMLRQPSSTDANWPSAARKMASPGTGVYHQL